MKQAFRYFFLSFTLLSVFTGIVYSQSGWVRQYPPSQIQNISLLSVSSVDANTGTVVGDSGTILHTTNGGADWTNQISGTTKRLSGVSVATVRTGTAVGDSGTILCTTNGGAIWTSQLSGTMNNLHGVCFTDSSIGTVVGDSGTILRTTNGGTTWMHQSSGTLYNLNSVSFIDANTGTVVGDSGTILRTTNGGITWASQSIVTNYQLYGVSFTGIDTGTAVGFFQPNIPYFEPGGGPGGIILRTTNGGTTWTSISSGLYHVWSMDPLLGVSFTDANTGIVVGYDGILRTTNGGGRFNDGYIDGQGYWTYQSIGALYGVYFIDTNTGTVVGGNGTILHTTTGGVTAVKNNPTHVPNQFSLEQNYPNLFNPTTKINFSLGHSANVSLKVFDILGREVATLVNGLTTAGTHEVQFNAANCASRIYFYKLIGDGNSQVKKMILVK